jgi:hypothetical protein
MPIRVPMMPIRVPIMPIRVPIMPIRVQAVLVNILEDQKVENINVVCYHKVGLACRSTHTLTPPCYLPQCSPPFAAACLR